MYGKFLTYLGFALTDIPMVMSKIPILQVMAMVLGVIGQLIVAEIVDLACLVESVHRFERRIRLPKIGTAKATVGKRESLLAAGKMPKHLCHLQES